MRRCGSKARESPSVSRSVSNPTTASSSPCSTYKYSRPSCRTYGASKSAEWALTNAIRVELRSAGTLVVGVHAGWIDTDMAAKVPDSKISTDDVAGQTLDAVERGDEEVLTGDGTRDVKTSLPTDLASLYPAIQKTMGRPGLAVEKLAAFTGIGSAGD